MLKALDLFVKKHGMLIMSCAFAFVVFGANIKCGWPFYEPKKPEGLEKFNKRGI